MILFIFLGHLTQRSVAARAFTGKRLNQIRLIIRIVPQSGTALAANALPCSASYFGNTPPKASNNSFLFDPQTLTKFQIFLIKKGIQKKNHFLLLQVVALLF